MSSEAFITIEGGLTRDIRVNATNSGKTVVTLPLAVSTRVKNRETGEYEDGPSMYYDAVVYGHTAENIANSETFKGQRFIVYGEVERRVWSGKDGVERDTNTIYARLIGASYRNATITATRNSRGQFTNGGGVNGGGQNPQYGGQAGGGHQGSGQAQRGQAQRQNAHQAPFQQPAQAPVQQQAVADPWASAPSTSVASFDEPPF